LGSAHLPRSQSEGSPSAFSFQPILLIKNVEVNWFQWSSLWLLCRPRRHLQGMLLYAMHGLWQLCQVGWQWELLFVLLSSESIQEPCSSKGSLRFWTTNCGRLFDFMLLRSLLWNPSRSRIGIPKGYRLFWTSWPNYGLSVHSYHNCILNGFH